MENHDWLCGLFDFNGDGRTDSVELFVGNMALQNVAKDKRNNEDHALDMDDWDAMDDDPVIEDFDACRANAPATAKPDSALNSSKPIDLVPPIPDKIDSAEYEKRKDDYKKKISENIRTCAVLAIFPLLFIVLALDMYNPRYYEGNGTAIFLAIVGIGILVLDICMLCIAQRDEAQRFEQVKEAHRKWEREQAAVEK